MPVYTYKARDIDGRHVNGEVSAHAEVEALKEIESLGVYPVEVKENLARGWPLLSRFTNRTRIKLDDRILFIRQFEAMLRAGVPLTVSLGAIGSQAGNPDLSEILLQVRRDIEGGSTLSQALRKHPALLSPIHVSLIEAGEMGGILDDILERLGELLEWDAENRARIRQATFYPSMVIAELGLAFVVILRFVFPRFKSLFASRGAELPLPTKIMIGLSDFTEQYWWPIVVGVILLAIAFSAWRHTDSGRRQFDAISLKIPIIGDLLLLILMSRFARVTASLLESGITFLRALSIVEKTIENTVIKEDIAAMATGIQKGRGIAAAIPPDGVFPAAVQKMLDVGEQSGRIGPMLVRISTFYDRQADYRIKNLTTVIEPILLVVLGVSVLFVALAVFMPMWDMTRVITGG